MILESRLYNNHPIIRLLSGENIVDLFGDIHFTTSNELDEKVDPDSVFQILDADSSQQEAIEAAKAGASFVLEGPPGTGKSQTIANIIAESLAAGKKILFVSQKSVALDVVHKRLKQKGLSEFCLEVHSFKKNKKDVIDDLGRSLTAIRDDYPVDTKNKKGELLRLRKELNNYVRELHLPQLRMNVSLFNLYGKLANLSEAENLRFMVSNPEQITPEKFDKQLSIIRKISSNENLINSFGSHPWKGLGFHKTTIQFLEEIEEKFNQIAENIQSLRSLVDNIHREFFIREAKTFEDIYNTLKVLNLYSSTIFKSEYNELIDRYFANHPKLFRFINIHYWQDKSQLRELQRNEEKLSDETIGNILLLRNQLYDGINPNKTSIINKSHLSSEEINTDAINKAMQSQQTVENLLNYSINLFNPNEIPEILQSFFHSPVSNIIDWFQYRSTCTNLIPPWLNLKTLIDEGNNHGLQSFINKALEEQILPEEWENVFKKRFYTLLSDNIIQSKPILQKFQSNSHKTIVERFQKLDIELIDLACFEIRKKLYSSRPASTWVKSDSAETSILKKELNKKRRIKPLRILFAEIPNLILKLKPCLMMSPLSVCQLINPNIYQFDIAIFDEASQIPPEYAVSTILRAKQVIIAGDRHQLPPTRFFQSLGSEDFDEDEYEIEDFESILNACDAINLPNKLLRWHYRSEDESLIAFSNYHFYNNKLFTFPNSDITDKSTGLEFLYIDNGVYRPGKGGRDNPVEAKKAAELAVELLCMDSSLSIGIVAFSQSQSQRIELEIENIRKKNPETNGLFDYDKPEHFFVKNLETVQGDERDIIIFSVGYGKNEQGNLSMNFGPLNRQGGERRLNVAVTRARKAVKLVSSIEPEDLDLSKTHSAGVSLLKEYMTAARDGIENIGRNETYNPGVDFDSPFEESVFNELSKRGIKLKNQVGVSHYKIDFGVIDSNKPGRFILGIECYGATYNSSPTARDRDRLRQQLLEDKFGWNIHRIWSRDWINNQAHEIEKVLYAIEESQLGNKKNSSAND